MVSKRVPIPSCSTAGATTPALSHTVDEAAQTNERRDKVDATSSSTEGEDRPTAWHRRLASTASFITVYSPRFVTLTDGNLPPAPAAAAAADAVTGG